MSKAKQRFVEAAFEILRDEGLDGLSIRSVANRLGVTSAALYKHFSDIEHLTAVASVGFLREYIEDARVLSNLELYPLELNLQLWESLSYHAFQHAPIIEKLFFDSEHIGNTFQIVSEYYELFPFELVDMKDYMITMLTSGTMIERNAILLSQAMEAGILRSDRFEFLNNSDVYIFRGMLASFKDRNQPENQALRKSNEFMNLLSINYVSCLESNYRIIPIKPPMSHMSVMSRDGIRNAYSLAYIQGNNLHISEEMDTYSPDRKEAVNGKGGRP